MSVTFLMKQKKLLDDGFWSFVSGLKPNKNVSKYSKAGKFGDKKVHQLTLAELKELYRISQK